MIKTQLHLVGSSSSGLHRTALALSISAALALPTEVYAAEEENTVTLPTIEVNDSSLDSEDSYAGGQINTRSNVGLLGSQSTFDTPYSIVSFTSDLIEDQQADTVADILKNDASAVSLRSPGDPTEVLSIRGFLTGSAGTDLYDGLPGIAHRMSSSLTGVERVEIFKGANALLTGINSAPGGIINIIPKTPTDAPLTRLTTSYASEEELSTHLDLSRRFGENDEFGVRFNGALQGGDGVIDGSENKLEEATLALQYKKNKLQLDAIFEHADQDTTATPQILWSGNITDIPDAPDGDTGIQQKFEYFDTDFSRNYIKAQYQLSDDWSLKSSYGKSKTVEHYLRTISRFDNDGGAGDVTQSLSEYYRETERTSARAGIEGLFNTGEVSHKVLFDVLRYTEERGSAYEGNYTTASSNIYNPTYYSLSDFDYFEPDNSVDVSDKEVSTSFAVADVIGFYNDEVQLTLGARHQQIKQIDLDEDETYDESLITPTLGVLVKYTENLSLYGNYIESLSAGEEVGDSYENAGDVLEPYVTEQLEFGAKWDLGKVALTTAIFQIERPSGLADDDNNYVTNGEQRNRGIEFNAFGNLTQDIRLIGGVTYLEAEYIETEDGEYNGNTVSGVPKLSVVMGFEWDVPSLQGVTFTGRANHIGSQQATADNTKQISSYELYDIGARYITKIADKDITFRADVSNVLDTAYWTTYVNSSNLLYSGGARQINLSAAIDF